MYTYLGKLLIDIYIGVIAIMYFGVEVAGTFFLSLQVGRV